MHKICKQFEQFSAFCWLSVDNVRQEQNKTVLSFWQCLH